MTGLKNIKICTAYTYEGKTYNDLPASRILQSRVEPIYEEVEGFSEAMSKVGRFNDLPYAAKNYIHRLEELVGVPVSFLSLGPRRQETIQIGRNINF
jgi:adenylosuccinate synthase